MNTSEFFHVMFLLVAGHFVCDFPLQGSYLSMAKNRYTAVVNFPWPLAMSAHCAIHAGMVLLITQSLFLAVLEFGIHFLLDTLKCENKIEFVDDQLLHVVTKVWWATAVWFLS